MTIGRAAVLLVSLLAAGSVLASQLEDKLLEVVRSSDFLLSGKVETVTVDHRQYIVSVGSSIKSDDSRGASVSAMRLSKLRAYDAMMKAIYGSRVISNEVLESNSVTTTDGGSSTRAISESLATVLREIGKGEMPPHIDIGNWKGDDGMYRWAIAIEIPEVAPQAGTPRTKSLTQD